MAMACGSGEVGWCGWCVRWGRAADRVGIASGVGQSGRDDGHDGHDGDDDDGDGEADHVPADAAADPGSTPDLRAKADSVAAAARFGTSGR